jgi:hypothetical protein
MPCTGCNRVRGTTNLCPVPAAIVYEGLQTYALYRLQSCTRDYKLMPCTGCNRVRGTTNLCPVPAAILYEGLQTYALYRLQSFVRGTSNGPRELLAPPKPDSSDSINELYADQGCWEAFLGTGQGSATAGFTAGQSSFTAAPGRQHNCLPSALSRDGRTLASAGE